MPSGYPSALDSLATNKTNSTTTPSDHPAHHNDMADAINKIEAELGIDPSGALSTVKARLDALDVGGGGGSVAGMRAILNRNSQQSIPTGVETTVLWDSEREDANGWHTAGGSDITVTQAGVYIVKASVAWDELNANSAVGLKHTLLIMDEASTAARVVDYFERDANGMSPSPVFWQGYTTDVPTSFRVNVSHNAGIAHAVGADSSVIYNRPFTTAARKSNMEFSVIRIA